MQLIIVVRDQAAALDFYTRVLGFEKRTDFTPRGSPRWVTVAPKGQDIEMSLFQAGTSDTNSPQSRWVPGNGSPWTLLTDDCRKDSQELKTRGMKFLAEPSEYSWGVGATFTDPDGNLFSLYQPSQQWSK
jgi:predicted enzyme related to lactoylglutathione lyase